MKTPETVGNQFGYVCPKCEQGDSLRISAKVWAALLPEGTDNSDSDTEWDDDSLAQCTGCLWEGKVLDLGSVEIEES